MEVKSEPLELSESKNRMEDPEDQMTISQFSKTRQQLPPPRILKRKRNEWRKRNPNLLRFWNTSPPLSSPNRKQVVPDQGEKNRRRRMYWSSVGANSGSMKQAKELQKKLVPEKMPTCVKFMCPTSVGRYFWMRLPLDFCKLNLPKEDCVITLVDENGEEYETKYIPGRAVLSGGWRAFSVAHKLVPKDTVLFQLIKATKLKVYILREKVPKKVILNTSSDGANSHSMKQAKELRKKLALEKMPMSSDAANSHSMKQAKELRKKLALEKMPTCMKFIRPSHVSGCFWLRLPVDFCKLNLPKEDCIITLVDERGEEYEMKYVAERVGIGGGWRAFSVAHKLVPKDTVLFQLIKATKFKVYILREKVAKKETLTEEDNVDEGASHHLSDLQKKNQNAIPPGSTYNPGPPAGEQFENESEDVGSQDLEGIRFATASMEFKNVKNFEDFTVTVNGWNIDSELPEHVRAKHYELCCSQKAFLHCNLTPVINCKLITEIISGTVKLANFIRSCKLITASKNDFANWTKCLDAFESMGMNVGFLQARLQQLVKLYNEAMLKRACLEGKIRNLEVMLMEIQEAFASKEKEIETLKWEAERHEVKFQAEVNAPW